MSDNLELYNKVRSCPDSAKKEIGAGRLKGFTDINPMWRIKVLTEVFGPCGIGWWYKITDKRMEGQGNEIRAFVDIELYYKWNGEVSQPVVGTGGASFLTVERNGAYTSDECYKMALTDAISVAAKSLGIGADVYWDKDRDKYTTVETKEEKPKEKPKAKPEPKPEPLVIRCECCGNPILPREHKGKKFSVDEIVDSTKKKYGKPLCWDCAVEANLSWSITSGESK